MKAGNGIRVMGIRVSKGLKPPRGGAGWRGIHADQVRDKEEAWVF
jgi:hypothetical protein